MNGSADAVQYYEAEREGMALISLVPRAFHLFPFAGIQRREMRVAFHIAVYQGEVEAIHQTHGESFALDLPTTDDEGFLLVGKVRDLQPGCE